MYKGSNNLLWFMAIFFAMTQLLYSQDYTLTPGDSIVAEIIPEDLSVFNFLQENTSTDTLYLSWEKVSDEVPAGWTAMICDNSICYPDLKASGSMLPVVPGEYGLMSLHITAIDGGGTAIIRYAVWDVNNVSIKDTLTWIIHSGSTGLEALQWDNFLLYTTGDQLVFRSPRSVEGNIKLINLEGSVCFSTSFSGPSYEVALNNLETGIYLVDFSTTAYRIQKKIMIQR